MAYNANIPQPTDKISNSQSDLLNNFIEIKNLVDVNHETFGSANQGAHKFITFTDQTASGAPATAGTNIDMYNLPISGVQHLYIKRAAGTPVPFTQSSNLGNGWTYLASGLIIAWGQGTIAASSGEQAVVYASALSGGWPGFSASFTPRVFITRIGPVAPSTTSSNFTTVKNGSDSNTGFTAQRSSSNQSKSNIFNWMAIGLQA